MPTEFRVLLVTCPGLKPAEKLAEALVKAKLAACVTILPQAVSYYRWEGKLEKAQEAQLLVKSKLSLLPELIRFIKERHPAKVPEILGFQVAEGDKAYLDWVGANTLFAKAPGA